MDRFTNDIDPDIRRWTYALCTQQHNLHSIDGENTQNTHTHSLSVGFYKFQLLVHWTNALYRFRVAEFRNRSENYRNNILRK